MKCKKLASLALAIVMVLALAVPAFAQGVQSPSYNFNDKQNQNVTMKGATEVPKIQIQLPSGAALTNSFLLNPYKIAFSKQVGESTVSGDGASTNNYQVISPILQIVNGTNSKLVVDVTVTTTLAGNLKLLAADYTTGGTTTWQNDTKNNAFLYVNLSNANAAVAAGTTTAASFTDGKSIVLKAGDVKTTKALVTPAATPTAPSYINVQFGGKMAEAPSTPWTDKDIATVAFAFTFTPNQNETVTS